jgi:hypothetical protein
VVCGVTVPPTAGYTIKMAKPGLTSTRSLVHVNGTAVSTPNLTENGKSVDGWPLTGVLLQEPGCKDGQGKPNNIINRWGEDLKKMNKK